MSFVHPALVWGTLLGLVPIIIHILSRRRYRTVRWAAMDFLLTAIAQRSRNLRIQDLILLALRVAVLVLAALVVSRPILSPKAAGYLEAMETGGPDAVMLLDTSYSMSTNSTGLARMEIARRKAHELLASLPERARVGVIRVNERAGRATDGLLVDRARIASAIDIAGVTSLGTNIAVGMTAAIEMLAGSTAPGKRVYLITDAQAQGFEQDRAELGKAVAEADPSIGFVVLVVPNERVPNLAVGDLRVMSRWFAVGSPIRFDARVLDVGEPAARDANVELWVDGRKVDRKRVELSDRQGVATFQHAFTAAGLVSIEARLGPDAVEIDNHRYVAVRIPDAIDVAVVTGEPSGDNTNSAHVYLDAALSRPGDSPDAPAGPPFAVRPRVSPSRLAEELDDALGVVVLADAGLLPAEAVRRLGEWVQQGGAVLIAVGDNYAATLGQFRSGETAAGRWIENTAVSLPEGPTLATQAVLQFDLEGAGSMSSTAGEAGPTDVPPIDFDSPGVRDALAAVHVLRAVTIAPSSESGWSVVLRLTDGRPALLTRDLANSREDISRGAGRLVLLATSLDASWCDLPFRAAMVPMLDDLLVWLTWPRSVSTGLMPGQTWTLSVPMAANQAGITVPDGSRVQAAGFVEPIGTSAEGSLRFDRTDTPGVYRLVGARSPDARYAAAVNIDPAESQQEVWSAEQIRSLFPRGRCEVVAADTPAGTVTMARPSGTEVWALLAVGLGVALLVETLLAYRFSYQKRANRELRIEN